MAKLTYENKEALNVNASIPDKNKVTDNDMNSIKEVTNNTIDGIGNGTDTWSSSETYAIGDKVIYENQVYINLTGTNSTNPASDTINWEVASIINQNISGTNLNAELIPEKINKTIYANDFKCKNLYNPYFTNENGIIRVYNGNVSVENEVFRVTATGADMYVWNVVSQGTSYTSDYAGQLYEFEENTYTISLSNQFTQNIITYYDANKVSLGYTLFQNNVFTINKTDKTGAKYFTIRFGNNNATSGTTYTTTVQLEVGPEATTYTSFKEFDNKEVYSFSEQIVGVWVDGSTLYKKTINFGYLPNATEKSVAHNISNLSKIIKVEQHIDNGSTYTSGFVTFASYSQTVVGVNMFGNNTNIIIRTSGNESGKYAYFTLYYTKISSGAKSIGETEENDNR